WMRCVSSFWRSGVTKVYSPVISRSLWPAILEASIAAAADLFIGPSTYCDVHVRWRAPVGMAYLEYAFPAARILFSVGCWISARLPPTPLKYPALPKRAYERRLISLLEESRCQRLFFGDASLRWPYLSSGRIRRSRFHCLSELVLDKAGQLVLALGRDERVLSRHFKIAVASDLRRLDGATADLLPPSNVRP